MDKAFTFFKYFLAFLILSLTFVTFIHQDLVHTVIMSTFWNQNLYEVCQGCNYLPLIYGLFYLWGLPLQFFLGRSFSDPQSFIIGLETDPLFFLYHKLLLVLLFLGSIYLTTKVAKYLKVKETKLTGLMFLLSPFSLFVIFFYGGYDIFSVFFSLIAFLFFVRKKYLWAFVFFSIALSFKFFALVIALSLLALLDKSLLKKIGYGLVLLSVPLFQFAWFYNDPFFTEGVLFLFKRHSLNQNILFNPSIIIALGFLIWLALLHFHKKLKGLFSNQNIIYIPFISILFLFCYSPIAPQWIVLILPYMYLIIVKENMVKAFVFIESLFFILFIVVVTNIWNRNIDLSIANRGLFEFFYKPIYLFKDFYVDLNNNGILFLLCFGGFYLYFFLPFILKFLKNNSPDINISISKLVYMRFFGLTFFLWLPFLLAQFSSKSIEPLNLELNSSFWFVYSNHRNDLYQLQAEDSVCELFTNPYDSLKFVGLRVDSIAKDSLNEVKFSYFLDDNFFALDNKYFDNKSIYLDLPKEANQGQVVQFCIQNSSPNSINLFVKNKEQSSVLSNHLKSFNNKNLPLHLHFKKP